MSRESDKAGPVIGVVGVGHMGKLHVTKLLQNRDVAKIVLYDSHSEKVEPFLSDSRVAYCPSINELLFDVDGVIIASPSATHFEIGKSALMAGVSTLIEKPICLRSAQAEELVRLAEAQKVGLQTGFVERFRLQKLLEGLDLSAVRFVETTRYATSPGREIETDVIWDLMMHDIDLVAQLMKSPCTLASVIGGSVFTQRTDFASAHFVSASGAQAACRVDRFSSEKRRILKIVTDQTVVTLDLSDNRVWLSKGKDTQLYSLGEVDALQLQTDAFVKSVVLGLEPVVTGADGWRAVQMCEQVSKAVESRNREVDLLKSPILNS